MAVPAMTTSPLCRVPFCTRIVAIGPRPLSSLDSMTVPRASLSGLALRFWTSATRLIISSSSSMPSPVLAETLTHTTSPPHSSGTRSYSVSEALTLSGSASGLSILLSATIIGTFAALAWFMASTVWGIIPSSAAMTRTAISVTDAPLARIAVNASCPGVSRNVMVLPPCFT